MMMTWCCRVVMFSSSEASVDNAGRWLDGEITSLLLTIIIIMMTIMMITTMPMIMIMRMRMIIMTMLILMMISPVW